MADLTITAEARDAAAARHPPVAPKAGMTTERMRHAAREFESFYLAQALQPMFEGISSEAPFGGGMAEDMWRSLLVDEYGKAMAKAGGIGIADAIVRGLVGVQEEAGARPAAGTASQALHPRNFVPKETTGR